MPEPGFEHMRHVQDPVLTDGVPLGLEGDLKFVLADLEFKRLLQAGFHLVKPLRLLRPHSKIEAECVVPGVAREH